MLKHTPLYSLHLEQGAKMVNFSGWELPLQYGSQLEEHHRVRQDAGVFDVSHMGIIDILGKDAKKFLGYMLSNNIDKLKTPGSAFYTCLLNESGGVVDDLIVYYIDENYYRLVVNAATREKDLAWLNAHSEDFLLDINLKTDYAMLAIQGPEALKKTAQAFPLLKQDLAVLKRFLCFLTNAITTEALATKSLAAPESYLIARTGYTGEDGLEMIIPKESAKVCWHALIQAGVKPVGLGARDTLRLEAGFNLYGQDMDEQVTPLESNLAWTVAFEPSARNFIGRQALEKQLAEGVPQKLVGLRLQENGVLRQDQKVFHNDTCIGKITSGSYSPTLACSIALARLSNPLSVIETCWVEIRRRKLRASIVQPPFVRKEIHE